LFYYFWRMHIWMHEIFHWIWILKIHVWMHEIWFFVLCSFFFEWCIYERMNFFIKSEFWIWMKMHVWIRKIWFFILFEEFIYECMKVWLNMNFWFEWKCMFECMKFDFLFFLKNAFMNVWNFCEFYERKCIVLYFFKNAFMNAWNFVNSLNENACLNAWVLFVFLILFFFLRMYLWMHETLWIFWMKVHVWIH